MLNTDLTFNDESYYMTIDFSEVPFNKVKLLFLNTINKSKFILVSNKASGYRKLYSHTKKKSYFAHFII